MASDARTRFVEAMKEIWYNAGDEYEEVCRPLFLAACDAFADAECGPCTDPDCVHQRLCKDHATCRTALWKEVFGD